MTNKIGIIVRTVLVTIVAFIAFSFSSTGQLRNRPYVLAGMGGSGTANTIAKFTASTTIGDSSITDDGSTVSFSVKTQFTDSADASHITFSDGNGAIATEAGTDAYFTTPNLSGMPSAVANAALGTANQVVAYRIYLDRRITVSRIAFYVGTGQAGANCSVGLYSSDGTSKLLDTGALACTAAGTLDTDVTDATIGPGFFWVAYTSDNAGVAVWNTNSGATNWLPNVLNSTTVHSGIAANASSAGVLPSTLGAVSSANYGQILAKFQGT